MRRPTKHICRSRRCCSSGEIKLFAVSLYVRMNIGKVLQRTLERIGFCPFSSEGEPHDSCTVHSSAETFVIDRF